MNSPPAQRMNAEKLTGTTGSLPRLLEKDKSNAHHKEDLEAIREFINAQTGFRFAYGSSDQHSAVIRVFAK